MNVRRRDAFALVLFSTWLLPLFASAQSGDAGAEEEEAVDVVVAADSSAVTSADIAALRSEMATLRRELDEARLQIAATAATPEDEAHDETHEEPSFSPFDASTRNPLGNRIAENLYLSSYIQAQYSGHQDSITELSAGGQPLNQDGFAVRRARIKLVGDAEYFGGVFELNATTSMGGFQVQLRRAEGYLQYRLAPNETPLVLVAAGVNDAFFGYDLNYSSRMRAFMERALIIRAIWPNPQDVGARVALAYRWFRLSLQATNGTPLGTLFQGFAPTPFPDLMMRAGVEVPNDDGFSIAGHVSALYGHGLHAGTPASNGSVQWTDRNEDGVLQNGELIATPPRAATPSLAFERWAVGIDLEMSLRTAIGVTQLYGEVILAQNMDRSLFVSYPILTGINQRMLGFYGAFVQEITPYALIGFRYDYYDPNSDVFDPRAGHVYPYDQTIQTFSPVVGVQLPNLARLTFQYDFVRDHLGRDEHSVPADLANDAWTIRLQVQL